MNFDTVSYDNIGEKMHIYRHESGLKAYVIPKKGYYKKNAAFATHYGSINSEFVIPGDKNPERVPDGVAHFLEHKLFEQEGVNAIEKFGEMGASPNAYTGFNQTAYIFSATEKFNDCLRLLLSFVQNPHITQESVESEKDIIGQEIRMYQDDAGWRVFFNLLNAMYTDNPVKKEIAGTMESVSNINKELLCRCYETFYHPANMMLLVVGDVEPEEVFDTVDTCVKKDKNSDEVKRLFPEREKTIFKKYIEERLDVSMPIFNFGFMDTVVHENGKDLMAYEISVKILLDMIVGRSSPLYDALYNEGLVNSTLDMDCTMEREYGFSIIGGESRDPVAVRDRFVQQFNDFKKNGMDRNDFERARKAMMGRFIRQFNSVDKISHAFVSVIFKDVFLFDYFEVYDKIDFKDMQDVLERHFNPDNLAMSVIKPIQGG